MKVEFCKKASYYPQEHEGITEDIFFFMSHLLITQQDCKDGAW